MIVKSLGICVLALLSCASAADLKNHVVADPKGIYHVFWTVDGEDIIFELQVATKGYIGFGFSQDGKMPGADVVIGWVLPNGTVHFHDRHAVGIFEPLIDSEQNYNLLNASENATHTILRFTRKLNTCDTGNDTILSDDTMRMIYSWHPDDPQNITGLPYHGEDRRGSTQIFLLSTPDITVDITPDITVWKVNMPNVTIPPQLTTYWCITVKLPPLNGPHDYVGFAMDVTPGNEHVVHHLLFYECVGNETYLEEHVANKGGFECVLPDTTVQLSPCQPPIVAWAIGSPGRNLPNGIGIPMGLKNGGVNYFRLEMHYNNVGEKKGIVDSSGMRLFLTSKIRKIKASVIALSAQIDYTVIIPPKQPSFPVTAFCPPECTSNAVPNDGITIFAMGFHSHLAGRKMSLRHFRGDKELKPIAVDNNYDFNYQELRELVNPVKVLPGGYSTLQEMCIAFIMYYPVIRLSGCIGGPSYDKVFEYFGVQTELDNLHITSPGPYENQTMFEFTKNFNWNAVNEAKLKEMYSMQYEGEKATVCLFGRTIFEGITMADIAYPANATMYVETDVCDINPKITKPGVTTSRTTTLKPSTSKSTY